MTSAEQFLLTPSWLATMTAPPEKDAGVVIQNQLIVDVGNADVLACQYPYAKPIDLGQVILLPGLVNAHTHLELTNIGLLPQPKSLIHWISALRARTTSEDGPAFATASAIAGARQSLACGVTCIGDISLWPAATRPVLTAAGLTGVSFGEVLGMATRVAQREPRLIAAIDPANLSQRLTRGIQPHAPYSIDSTGFQRCIQTANQLHLPLATHLAETPDESTFLDGGQGPFGDLWQFLGGLGDARPQFKGGPIRYAHSLGLLTHPTLLAHVNYCDDAELALLAQGKASVVYCPRTHAYFNHPLHRFQDMLQHGINVALGTDSAASSGDVNLLADLRLLHNRYPKIPAERIWTLVTINGAKALHLEGKAGIIAPGVNADLCAFTVTGNNPLLDILNSNDMPTSVWIQGKRIS